MTVPFGRVRATAMTKYATTVSDGRPYKIGDVDVTPPQDS